MDEFLKYKNNPRYGNLFRQVLGKLEPDFVSVEVQEQARRSQIMLKESIQRYFKHYILMDNVMKAANGIQSSEEVKHGSITDAAQLDSDTPVHPLYFKMLEKLLQPPEAEENTKFLGLDQTHLSKKMLERKFSKDETNTLSRKTEIHLQTFCKKLVEYVGCSNYVGINMRKAFSETMKFLSSKAILLEPKYNVTINSSLDEMLCSYNKELCESLVILKDVLNLNLRKIRNEKVYSELFAKDCEMLLEKIRSMELTYLADTYSVKKVKVLSIIKNQMCVKEECLLKEQAELSAMLSEYHVLGPHYRELVEEYSRLKRNLQHLEWAVDNMKQKQEIVALQESVGSKERIA